MSESESTGGKYDSDDSYFDPAAEYGWLGEYGKLLRACGFMMNRYFDGCLEKYWTLRLGLRVIGRRSAAQQLVLEDTYLANYLGSFVVGEFVLSNRPTYPPDPVYVIPSGLPQPEVPSWVELVAPYR